jgi:DNA-directed RNA polymerase subunit omega
MHDALSLLPEDVKRFGSRSRLVVVAAQQARQFMRGIPTGIVSKHSKPTTVALERVLNGKVKYLVGKDAREAIKEAKKERQRELDRLTIARVSAADAQEIKKDLGVVVDDSKPVEIPDETPVAKSASDEWDV